MIARDSGLLTVLDRLRQGNLILMTRGGEKVGIVSSCFKAFCLDSPFSRSVLPQQVQGYPTNQDQVLRSMVFANARSIFIKGNIQHPVNLVFNAPMGANRLSKLLHTAVETEQISSVVPEWGVVQLNGVPIQPIQPAAALTQMLNLS